MATAVTTDVLRELAGFHASSGCAISIYLAFDPSSTPTIPDVETKFNAVRAEAEKKAAGVTAGRDCRMAVKDDLARLRDWWDDDFDRDGTRGVAVFASSADGFFRALPLARPAGDSVHIGPSLHLAPLAGVLDADGALVAFVTRERGTLYRLEAGRLREIADESEEQPGRHDQGGWSQANYQRHIEHLVQQHLKSVGEVVDAHVRGRPPQIAIVGPEEMRREFEATLSHEARSAIVGWASVEAHARPDELLEVVRPLLAAARARADSEALERFQELHGRRERSAAGWKQVLEAASDARVGVLLVEEGPPVRAWQCPECGRASADGGNCPIDGTKLAERPDAVDLALHQTLAHGGSVTRVGAGALGDAKVGALLRF